MSLTQSPLSRRENQTNDVDLIVMMKAEDIERFVQSFPSTEFYCPPTEVPWHGVVRSAKAAEALVFPLALFLFFNFRHFSAL